MRRGKGLSRKHSKRRAQVKFYIYCEGKNTEPDYFVALSKVFDRSIIEVVPFGAVGAPFTIATKAAAKSKEICSRKYKTMNGSYADNDQVWVLFDRDDHPRIPDAIELCNSNQIGVGYSNPCFELWLILHEKDFDSPVGRHEVQKECEGTFKDYDRKSAKTFDFNCLVGSVTAAEARAEVQLRRRNEEGNPPNPPFTTVFELTQAIAKSAE